MTAARIYFNRIQFSFKLQGYGFNRVYTKPFIRSLSGSQGDVTKLATKVRKFVEENVKLMTPAHVFICNGSEEESQSLLRLMQKQGMAEPLPKYQNCWLTRTDPADVARVESKTLIASQKERDTIPKTKNGAPGQLGKWISIPDLQKMLDERLPGCMAGRTMYVIPFSMGPVGSPLAKIGIQVTDSAYVVSSMKIMTRMGQRVLDVLGDNDFVECIHSVGQPLPMKKKPTNNWPCNPDKTIISHIPEKNKIASFGSGYGGNSLLGKKCFALRIGSTIAKREGWLAEHMLILGITNPKGVKKYITAAFPSACGKTNLAMMNPTLPGYKIECVGDDIAWMKFDSQGRLRAINPENGFFGVAPGTSYSTNPNAMDTIQKNTLFTNVGKTSDGGFYWEGLEKETPAGTRIVSWLGEEWTPKTGRPAAHANSRFCTPASQCPIIDPQWESNEGVPIEAILFGGRRPQGVPLVYESFDWKHGVFIGASMRSEATAAAEHKGKVIMHDPFAMRPFFGYNFGHYLSHWLSMEKKPKVQLPRIFHVNWFRKDAKGNFLWPGFGDNSRVLEWVFRRCDGEDVAQESAIGYIPKSGTLNVNGLTKPVDMDELFRIPKDFWMNEVEEINHYFDEQVNEDLPDAVAEQLKRLKQRVEKLP